MGVSRTMLANFANRALRSSRLSGRVLIAFADAGHPRNKVLPTSLRRDQRAIASCLMLRMRRADERWLSICQRSEACATQLLRTASWNHPSVRGQTKTEGHRQTYQRQNICLAEFHAVQHSDQDLGVVALRYVFRQ